ncbi:MAG: SusC/RagA family TonB-linked outer membrane protein [Prolixibacteraceae bacterium]|nr:SusC/RagA family TonB-linked outer membrane protein [Prolixibacteraceae bacterium]
MKLYKILLIFGLLPLLCASALNGQNSNLIKVKAIVSDQDDNPVAGASVYGNEGYLLKFTDSSGSFEMEVNQNTSLYIVAEGFLPKTVKVLSGLEKISLVDDSGEEKVNVAFTQVNRKDLHGAISVVNPGEFLNEDYYRNTSGINNRANGILWGSNLWGMDGAMVMIDGAPRRFEDIKMDEIDQITVLKGVNAVALYGSHAAKGVILITTKRGVAHKREINVRVNTGIASPKSYPKYLGSADYMTLYNEARVNDGMEPLFDEETIANFDGGNPYRYPSIDFYSPDYLNNFTYATDIVAEFSGGNENAKFYTNVGWSTNSTLLKVGEGDNESINRFNIRGNIDLKLNDFITSTVDVSVILNDSRNGLGNYWDNATTYLPHKISPFIPIGMIAPDSASVLLLANNSKNIIDGEYLLGGTQEYLTNPFADLYVGGYSSTISRVLQVSNGIDFDFDQWVKGLSFHTKIYADYYNSYNQSIENTYSIYTPTWGDVEGENTIVGLTKYGNDSRPGVQNVSGTAQQRLLGGSVQFNYDRTFNEKHNFSSILLGQATAITKNGVYQDSLNTNIGIQLAYNYQHKYWADFSGALVNSTKLPDGNRVGFSPTISLGWLISAEDFFKAGFVDHLKITASAGILNTDLDIPRYYLYDNIYMPGSWYSWYDGTYVNRATTSQYGLNPKLTFAKRQELNFGLQGSLFNKLIWFETSFFMAQMNGLPTQPTYQYPEYISDWVPYTNYNANEYSGIDASVNLNKKVGDWQFNLGMIATYVTTKVLQRDELYEEDYRYRTGKPTDAIFGFENLGLFDDADDIAGSPFQAFGDVKPGDIKYKDQNGDNVIDEKDEVMIGRWVAPFSYALNFSVSYKNLTLFVQGTGNMGGNGITDDNYYWVDADDKYSEIVLGRWTEETKASATYPRLSSQSNNNNFRSNDYWLYSTDRFNLNKVQLTYNLPRKLIQRTFIRELGVYINGSNLLTLSQNSEILELNIGEAPQNRYYNVGIRMKF